MKYKLIAMNLDGTLNNSQKIITERTRSALMQAQQQGIRLALASARPSPGLFKERDILQLQQYGGILMSYKAAALWMQPPVPPSLKPPWTSSKPSRYCASWKRCL